MTSFIAFLIAISLGTASFQQTSDFEQQQIEVQKLSKDDGIGMGHGGSSATDDPNDRP